VFTDFYLNQEDLTHLKWIYKFNIIIINNMTNKMIISGSLLLKNILVMTRWFIIFFKSNQILEI
jgi:hypothetical protein